ncbi:MAG: hypothetical protein V3V06_07605 [Dehalococcoidia bacterium]
MTLTAGSGTVQAGGSTTVTATVLDSFGAPLFGTNVGFVTTLGAFGSRAGPQSATTTTNTKGQATVALFSTASAGLAVITASAGSISAFVVVTFVGPPASVTIVAAARSVEPDSSTAITAAVLDALGTPVSATPVTFSTTLGAFGSPTGPQGVVLLTGLNGQASVSLFSPGRTGAATVTAAAGTISARTDISFVGLLAASRSIRGARGRLALLDEPPVPTPEQIAVREAAFAQANPPEPAQAPGAIPPPSVPPTPLPDEPDPVAALSLPLRLPAAQPELAGAGAAGSIASTATTQDGAALSPEDFAIFRNEFVIQRQNVTSNVGEPTAHNIGPAVFQTGNWYAALSPDSGNRWQFLDPLQDTDDWPSVNGGFCCDQVVISSNSAAQPLLFWLLQYSHDGETNTIRLVAYEGPEALAEQQFCIFDFNPQEHFEYPGGVWLDFTQLATTREWLYASSNAFEIGGGFLGSVVWRIALADAVGSYDRGCTELPYDFWTDPSHGSLALTVGADSTMYWASHHGSTNDRLRLAWVDDASTEVLFDTKVITTFPPSGRGDSNCVAPDGNDPCLRGDRRISAAWTGNGVVGFMWTAAQGGAFPYPHVRVARFRTDGLTLIDEPEIYSPDFGWAYPAVGVNSRGHSAGVVYALGGDVFPRAYAFIMDDVSGAPPPWELHALRFGDDAPENDRWGDFGSTTFFDGCENTWLAGIYTMQGGGSTANVENRFVWFGRERDRCADLLGGAELSLALQPGWNLVGWGGADTSVEEATGSIAGAFSSVFTWSAADQAFRSFNPTAPPFLNTLQSLTTGDGLWLFVESPGIATWEQPSATGPLAFELGPGFNLVMWTGADGTPVAEAVAGIGGALVTLFTWDAAQQAFLSFSPTAPAFLNTATTLNFGDGVWVQVSGSATWNHGSP